MQINKFYILLLIFFVQIQFSFAQRNYGFISKEYVQLSDEQVNSGQIMITPDVLIFSSKGQLLPQSQMSLMANPEYRPIFFADTKGNIKALVFERKSNNPTLIEKNPEASFEEGEFAKDFIVTDLKGKNIKLSELRGKVVVLNFWFIKCKPCITEMPHLNELKELYNSKDVEFIAITFDKKEMIEQFLDDHSFNYSIVANANDAINIYGVNSFPTNMVINQKGEIVLKEIGYRTNIKDVLKASIDKLLQ